MGMKTRQKGKVKSQKWKAVVVFFIFHFSFFIFHCASAQSPTINKSDKVETIDGRKFYIHPVEKGQTLYSIARTYGTTVDIVLSNNPDAIDGLKVGSKLKIPVLNSAEGTKNEIEKKEISGREKRAERKKQASKNDPDGNRDKNKSTVPPLKTDSVSLPVVEPVKPIGDIHVAVFLPLSLAMVDQIDVGKIAQGDEKLPEDVKTGIEFYEGIKIAFDSLKKDGFKGYLHIYDTNLDSVSFIKLMKKPELKEMDMIIGPLSGKKFEPVLRFAKENDINIVSPTLQGNNILMGNQNVSKTTPSYVTQADFIGKYVGDKFSGQNIIVFNSANPKDKAYISTFKKTVNPILLKSHADTVKEMMFTTMNNFLSTTKPNIIVIPSTNQSFVTEAVSKLFLHKQENKDSVVVFGMSNWSETESLDFSYLHSLYAHIISFNFVDYSNPATKKFIVKYRNEFMTEPTQYVYSGFDIGYFYLSGLQKYGNNLQKKLPELKQKGIQTQFDFYQSDSNSGYENKGVGLMKFENYSYTRIK